MYSPVCWYKLLYIEIDAVCVLVLEQYIDS